MTASHLDFYFDFISPFGYFASLRIDSLAARHDRAAHWHGMLVGVSVMKVMGMPPVPTIPLKGPYVVRDALRYARRHDISLRRDPSSEPGNPIAPGRLFAWAQTQDASAAHLLAQRLFDRYWLHADDLADQTLQAALCAECGLDWSAFEAATARGEPAALLKANVDASLARGVFGSPFFIVDDEPFFGVEKMELLEAWLQSGGW